jgi:hypothetical protein
MVDDPGLYLLHSVTNQRRIIVSKAEYISVLLITVLLWFSLPKAAFAQPANSMVESSQNPVPHDGRHDFDFEVGTWKAHVRKLVHPLAGSNEWDDFVGTVVTRTLPMLEGWNESEMKVDSPTSHTHIELLAVRLYSPTSKQWSIYGSNIKTGTFDPPQVGQFDNKRGEFYAQDDFQGRAIYIRFLWQSVTPDSTHFEQAFSSDGGKTWETNWIYDGTRVKD